VQCKVMSRGFGFSIHPLGEHPEGSEALFAGANNNQVVIYSELIYKMLYTT